MKSRRFLLSLAKSTGMLAGFAVIAAWQDPSFWTKIETPERWATAIVLIIRALVTAWRA